jgi:hypothetical protein
MRYYFDREISDIEDESKDKKTPVFAKKKSDHQSRESDHRDRSKAGSSNKSHREKSKSGSRGRSEQVRKDGESTYQSTETQTNTQSLPKLVPELNNVLEGEMNEKFQNFDNKLEDTKQVVGRKVDSLKSVRISTFTIYSILKKSYIKFNMNYLQWSYR